MHHEKACFMMKSGPCNKEKFFSVVKKKKKTLLHPVNNQFYYIKVGFKGVYFSWTCIYDVCFVCLFVVFFLFFFVCFLCVVVFFKS